MPRCQGVTGVGARCKRVGRFVVCFQHAQPSPKLRLHVRLLDIGRLRLVELADVEDRAVRKLLQERLTQDHVGLEGILSSELQALNAGVRVESYRFVPPATIELTLDKPLQGQQLRDFACAVHPDGEPGWMERDIVVLDEEAASSEFEDYVELLFYVMDAAGQEIPCKHETTLVEKMQNRQK